MGLSCVPSRNANIGATARGGVIHHGSTGSSADHSKVTPDTIAARPMTLSSALSKTRLGRPSDAPDIFGSHDKLAQESGWLPRIGLEQTIRDVVDDLRSRQ
jgi:hypothetical protein